MAAHLLIATLALALARGAAAQEPVFAVSASWQAGPPPAGGEAVLRVLLHIEDGWHVNSHTPEDPYLIPTTVRVSLPHGWNAGPPQFPPHKLMAFAFSEKPLAVYEGRVAIAVAVRRGPRAGTGPVTVTVRAQACNDAMCLAPAEVTAQLAGEEGAAPAAAEPGAGVAQGAPPLASPRAAPAAGALTPAGFGRASLPLQLLLVFLAGLALNLTPCVYPLIPVTVGFFMAQRPSSRAHSWLLASLYVAGMGVTYSALGVAAALTGGLFGAALQSPWAVAAIAAALLALAASMFGLWELRVPPGVARLAGGRTGALGALMMGLVVGLVAAPCIGPFVLGLLTYVSQQGSPSLGFLLFFTLAMGLGLPYLFLAVFTGALERLPHSGAWMLGVRQLFGILLVGLAAYFVAPLLPAPRGEQLLAAVLMAGGAYLLVVARPGHEHPWIDRVLRAASAGVLVAGVALYPAGAERPTGDTLWRPYNQAEVERAIASGAPVILDFYATWCAPCKELDRKTFSDPRVAARLAEVHCFKVDLTRADPATEAVRARYGVAGVPTIAFFLGGREIAEERLTGFEPPESFLRRLERAGLGRAPGGGPTT